MKATKLAALGLIGMTALGLAAPIANAAEKNIPVTTKGEVKFSTGTGEEIPNPGGPGTVDPEKVPGGESNTDDPDLKILFAPNFVFGEGSQADGTWNEQLAYDAAKGNTFTAMKQVVNVKDEDGNVVEEKKLMDNFAQIFNSDQVKDWKLSVKASDFYNKADKADEQPKMTMNVKGTTVADGESQYGVKAAVTTPDFVLGDEAVTIGGVANTNGEGAVNSFMFSDVTLNVPQGLSIKDNVTYISDITWTLTGNVE